MMPKNPHISKARKFLFARYSHFLRDQILVTVEAYDKEHALLTLRAEYPQFISIEWDFVEELEPSHFLGVMGRDIPLTEISLLHHIISKRMH
jgi:hypothetical protein